MKVIVGAALAAALELCYNFLESSRGAKILGAKILGSQSR